MHSTNTIILYRKHDTDEEEVKTIHEFFEATSNRTAVSDNQLVIGRYSVLPYYRELELDLAIYNSRLVNSYAQHEFVADIGQWSEVLAGFTPQTWVQGQFDLLPEDKSFVLKGQTNSKKFLWNTHMFAKDKDSVRDVMSLLLDDSLIGRQTIYAREYVPLITYGHALNGLPITKEFRFFVLYGEVVCGGYYWSNYADDVNLKAGPLKADDVPEYFLKKVVEKIGDLVSFYAIDIAQTQTGDWTVIDVNDGQMSGLSEIQPRALYMGMTRILRKRGLL